MGEKNLQLHISMQNVVHTHTRTHASLYISIDPHIPDLKQLRIQMK